MAREHVLGSLQPFEADEWDCGQMRVPIGGDCRREREDLLACRRHDLLFAALEYHANPRVLGRHNFWMEPINDLPRPAHQRDAKCCLSYPGLARLIRQQVLRIELVHRRSADLAEPECSEPNANLRC